MQYSVVSNISEKVDVFIDETMTVGDVRAVIAAMIGADLDTDEVKLTYVGKPREVDDDLWSAIEESSTAPSGNVGKIFVFVRRHKKRTHGASSEVSSEALRAALPSKSTAKEEEAAKRQQAEQMEPMIDAITSSPNFFDMMLAMQPELKSLIEKNPSMEQELRNPETLKSMMMAQIDPDRKRQLSRSLQMQMAQVSALPEGSQMLDHYMNKMAREMNSMEEGVAERDTHDTAEETTRPDPNKESNNEEMPNPWATPAPARNTNPQVGGGGIPPGLANLLPLMMLQQQQPQQPEVPIANAHLPRDFLNGPPTNLPSRAPNIPEDLRAAFLAAEAADREAASQHASAPTDAHPSSDYAEQMVVLKEMGFAETSDQEAVCRQALQACNGDIDNAVMWLSERLEDEEETE